MKRAIKIEDIAGDVRRELNLTKVTAIMLKAKLLHFCQLPDGTWRITHTKNLFGDISAIKSFDLEGINVWRGVAADEAKLVIRGAGIDLPIGKVVPLEGEHNIIHFDFHEKSGKFNLLYNTAVIQDITDIASLKIHRED